MFETRIPTDQEIREAQEQLGFVFPSEYIQFIKSGYHLGDVPMEALELNSTESRLDIQTVRSEARKYYELPENLLPICEDNSDYYCLNEIGEVVFWSHNGSTNEKWPGTSDWCKAMIAEHS